MKKTTTSLILGTSLLAAVNIASAQTTAAAVDVAKELAALKTRIMQLEQQLQSTDSKVNAMPAGGGAVDLSEFNRIRVKTEAIEDNFEAQGFKGLKINGWMDPTVIASKTRGTSFNFMNKFDASQDNTAYAYDNSYFGMAMLDLQKEMDGGTKWRLTLAPQKASASGYNIGSIVHEASVSVPLGDLQTRFIAGQIPDWSGYEYIPSTQNKLITHNLLFDFTMPNYYTGAGMEIVSGKWTMKGLVGNLNSNRYAKGDKSPLLTYRVDYAKGEYDGFGFAGQHGKAATSKINLFEVDAYFVRGNVSLFGQLSAGKLAGASSTGGDAKWAGASVTAAYKLTPKLELVGRLDMIKNKKNGGGVYGSVSTTNVCPDGVTTGCTDGVNGFGSSMAFDTASNFWQPTGQGVNRSAMSLGLNYLYSSNVTFKAEYRLDRASGNVFYYASDDSYRKSNGLFGLSAVVSF